MPLFASPIYLVTDRRQTAGRPLHVVIEQALAAGVRAVQLREPDLPTRGLLDLAKDLRALTAMHKAQLLINDRLDLALAVGADGVHLRASSLPVAAARRIMGSNRLVGISTHSLDEVMRAQQDGADFAVLGPIYDTPSKRGFGAPIGLGAIEKAAAQCRIPIFAIGGVSASRAAELRRAGASGVALISAVLSAPAVGEAAADVLRRWHDAASASV